MNIVMHVSYAMMVLPLAIILGFSYTAFQYTSPFIFLGISSLIMIMTAERVKWFGIVTVYIPAFYAVYVLIAAGNPTPFIALAAGYIMAVPLVLMISMATSRSPSGLITSYFTGYVASLMLYGAIFSGYATPERLFIFLVRGFFSYLGSSESLGLIPPQNPDTILLATPTAISTLGLVIRLMASGAPAKGQPGSSPYLWLKALILSLLAALAASSLSGVDPALSAALSLALASSMLSILAVYSRR